MKAFLASSFDVTADLLDEKIGGLNGRKVLFIENASDPDLYEGDKWWVRADEDAFISRGAQISKIDLRIASPDDLKKAAADCDIIHIAGGGTIYLLSLLKERGLIEILKDAVINSGKIYCGTSAGSMIAARDVSLEGLGCETDAETFKNLPDTLALGFVDFMIVPHANNKTDFLEDNLKYVEHVADYGFPLLFIHDNEAVWCEGNKFEIVRMNK